MSESKRPISDQDPDYDNIVSNDQKRLKVIEKDNKEATIRKIESIIKTQFNKERQLKEIELEMANKRLYEARRMLDQLRACIVISYYTLDNKETSYLVSKHTGQPNPLHPTIKRLFERMGMASFPSLHRKPLPTSERVGALVPGKGDNSSASEEKESTPSEDISVNTLFPNLSCEDGIRGARFKEKKRIIVGNVSKYIPIDKREERDQSTHKWMVYVRGSKEEPRIDHFVKKVWFFLHPSYRPNDLVEVNQYPFHLTRRGWGEFPVRVQLHFHDQRNKKVDILHTLKLDKSYTGLQTLGAETLVDVLVYRQGISGTDLLSSRKSNTAATSLNETQDLGGIVIPANAESEKNFITSGTSLEVMNIKEEPMDPESEESNQSFIQPPETMIPSNSGSTIISVDTVLGLADESEPNSRSKSPDVTSLGVTQESEVDNAMDSRPTNGLSTFIKCVDKHGNIYLIPLSMFLKLTPETQASVIQSVQLSTTIMSSNQDNVVAKVIASQSSCKPRINNVAASNSTTTSLLSKQVSLLSPGVKNMDTSTVNATQTLTTAIKDATFPKVAPPRLTNVPNSPDKWQSDGDTSLPINNRTKNNILYTSLTLDSFDSIELIMKQILKFYPLINPTNDKTMHPFCCSSMSTFFSWNIGKRHASEWQRSKAIRIKLLQLCSQSTKWDESQIWSVKEIYMFCRYHGYTPMKTIDDEDACETDDISDDDISTYTEASTLLDRLKTMSENSNESIDSDNDEDAELDVVNIDDVKKPKCAPTQTNVLNLVRLRLPLTPSCRFVKHTMEELGLRVGLERAAPGVLAPLAEEALLAATQSLMEDIIRTAHASAFEKNINKRCPPSELTVSDVAKAVAQLPNCDFLTNQFMGTKIQQHHAL